MGKLKEIMEAKNRAFGKRISTKLDRNADLKCIVSAEGIKLADDYVCWASELSKMYSETTTLFEIGSELRKELLSDENNWITGKEITSLKTLFGILNRTSNWRNMKHVGEVIKKNFETFIVRKNINTDDIMLLREFRGRVEGMFLYEYVKVGEWLTLE